MQVYAGVGAALLLLAAGLSLAVLLRGGGADRREVRWRPQEPLIGPGHRTSPTVG